MLYQEPKLEILFFPLQDVICASVGDSENPTYGDSDGSGDWDT